MEKSNVSKLDFDKLFKIEADPTTFTQTYGTDISSATCFGDRQNQQDSLQVNVLTNFVGSDNTIIQDAILQASNQVGEYCKQFHDCGTTLTSAFVYFNNDKITNIITTNIGDSGIFLVQQLANNTYSCERLTDIHNFGEATEEERARITNIEKLSLEKISIKTYIVYPTKVIDTPCKLLLTRSLGHGDISNLSHEASINLKQYTITATAKSFLILFSDGFTDDVNEEIITKFFTQQLENTNEDILAKQLCHLAYAIQQQKKAHRIRFSPDNKTVIVIPLHKLAAHQAILATVCDGHGNKGHEPAQNAAKAFYGYVKSNLKLHSKQTYKTIQRALTQDFDHSEESSLSSDNTEIFEGELSTSENQDIQEHQVDEHPNEKKRTAEQAGGFFDNPSPKRHKPNSDNNLTQKLVRNHSI